jgi:hypothetical protein
MILSVILACVYLDDADTCYPLPNTTTFFETMEECEEVSFYAADHIAIQFNVYTKPFCFETDYFELL